MFVILSGPFIAALWSLAGKRPISWLSFVMYNCVFVTFPCGILGQVWYLIVSIPDLCHLSYFTYLNLLFLCIRLIMSDLNCSSTFLVCSMSLKISTIIGGATRGLGIWGEWLFIFRELGSTGNYFHGFREQAHSFGDLGSPANK